MKVISKSLVLLLVSCISAYAQEDTGYQRPPEEIARLLEAPLTPAVMISPDKTWMVLLDRSDFPSIEELSRPELRLAGLRINPDNFGPSRNNFLIGLKARNMKDSKEYSFTNLPSPLQMSNVTFAPNGKAISFLQTYPDRIELWIADFTDFDARKITKSKINNSIGVPYVWLSDSERIVFSSVEPSMILPEKSRVPSGPVIEQNLGKKAPNRTYQDLLKNSYDEKIFEFYATSRLVVSVLGGLEIPIGEPQIYSTFNPSPDGRMILIKTIQKPYSYLVPASMFPQTVHVIDLAGKPLKKIADIPLADNLPLGFNATLSGPRGHSWRNDMPSTLYWMEAQDGGDPKAKADVRDKVFLFSYPFSEKPKDILSLPLRYAGITWANQNLAWAYETWWSDRTIRVYQFDPSVQGPKKIIYEGSFEDAYNDPGDVITETNSYGRPVMAVTKDNTVFLTGIGASPEGDRPFLDKMDLKTGRKTRMWRSEAPYFESVINLIDKKSVTFITSRESQAENPNYFLRGAGTKTLTQLTSFPHPYPQIRDVKKELLKYKRDDGVDLTAELYLPPGYKKALGPLPAFLWAYPEEFKSKENAGQVKGSPYSFTRISSGSALFWVMRGYAIINNASIPIVGEGNQEPNDSYVKQLVASAKAAIDHTAALGVVDSARVGVGGHSYGAFMTANLLAHCDLFKAGIARSGAYNRTLTPFGFQSEERTYWQAPEVYHQMSPFSFADQLKEPVLFIHGEADNNSGTFPIQTERFYNAIKGHGGTARYVLLPYESHGYRARESILHMLWEMDTWLETYVKPKSEKPEEVKVNLKN